MAKLNKQESGRLLTTMETPGWQDLMKLAALTVADLSSRQVPGQNAFEVLKSLHTREGKVAAIQEFFKDLEDGVSLSV